MSPEQTSPSDTEPPDDAEEPPDGARDETGDAQASLPRPRLRRWIPGIRPRLATTLLALITVGAAALTTVIYFTQDRPDQQTDHAAVDAAIRAASAGTVALLSYSPESTDHDFSAAEAHLTGDFLTYYTKFTQQIVGPAAKQRGVKATANVVRAAVSEMHPRTAVVLVYIDQSSVSKEKPDPEFFASSVLVTVEKNNNTWLISKFQPV